MLILQLVAALALLLIGRFLFYSFVRHDSAWVLALRYGGLLGITVLTHYYLGNLWTWIFLLISMASGLVAHYLYVRKHGYHFFKQEKQK